MADEKTRNRHEETDQEKGKAMGAGASGNYQGDQGQQGHKNEMRGTQPNEVAGQGGGVQGTGQSQSNPGGFTQGQYDSRDESRRGDDGKSMKDKGSTRGHSER
jgi:hypothetical protein